MTLSALEVRSAEGRERPYKLSDAKGLYLFVQPSGQRYWRLAYRWSGKQQAMALGIFPDVSLAEAREKREAVRAILAEGRNPATAAKEEALAAKLAEQATFHVIAQEWRQKCQREGRAPITLHKHAWLLEFAYPLLGDKPIAKITALEVYEVLRGLEAKGHYETARRLCGACSQVFQHAALTGRADRDTCAGLRRALVKPKVTHLAGLTKQSEVGALMCAIDRFDGYRVTHAALRLAPHLFVRPGELRQAEWAEFDFDAKIWSIPAEKMKMRRPHEVPLSRQALAIIEEIRPFSGDQRYLFPAQGKRDRPMCENTLNLALQRLGYGGRRMTAHGFRVVASTLLNESGAWSVDAVEWQLAHVDPNPVRRIYNRGQYWDERVRMMQAWSDTLDQLKAEARARSAFRTEAAHGAESKHCLEAELGRDISRE